MLPNKQSSEINTLIDQVIYCMEKYPDARNSDKKLTWMIWKEFYNVDKVITEEIFSNLPTEDNIKRIRAHIQNVLKKLIPTSWEVAEQRKWKEVEWRMAMGYFDKDNDQFTMFI